MHVVVERQFLISAILASPKHWAFIWSYRSSIYRVLWWFKTLPHQGKIHWSPSQSLEHIKDFCIALGFPATDFLAYNQDRHKTKSMFIARYTTHSCAKKFVSVSSRRYFDVKCSDHPVFHEMTSQRFTFCWRSFILDRHVLLSDKNPTRGDSSGLSEGLSEMGYADKLTLALIWTLTLGFVTLMLVTLALRDFRQLPEEPAKNLLLTWIKAFRPLPEHLHLQSSQQHWVWPHRYF